MNDTYVHKLIMNDTYVCRVKDNNTPREKNIVTNPMMCYTSKTQVACFNLLMYFTFFRFTLNLRCTSFKFCPWT